MTKPTITGITGAIRGSSKKKLYQELGFESLQIGRWFWKSCFFYKIYKNNQPSYLSSIIPQWNFAFNTTNAAKAPLFEIKHNFFKNTFFPSTVIEWNKLDTNFHENSFHIFWWNILKFTISNLRRYDVIKVCPWNFFKIFLSSSL